MRLSNNFTLEEFERSYTAKRLGINNTAPEDVINNLRNLCVLLQILRDYYRTPVSINSGYRSPILNEKIGGSKNSQHMRGQAADLSFDGMETLPVILKKYKVSFDQLIIYKTFVHISHVSFQENRKQIIYK